MLLLSFWKQHFESGVLSYHGYTPGHARQAPLWGGALRAGLQHSREEEGGTWELCWLKFSGPEKSTFFLRTPDCSFKCKMTGEEEHTDKHGCQAHSAQTFQWKFPVTVCPHLSRLMGNKVTLTLHHLSSSLQSDWPIQYTSSVCVCFELAMWGLLCCHDEVCDPFFPGLL